MGVLRPSVGAVADAIGQSLLGFAFLPPLAALPAWLAREAVDDLNRQDSIVLAFLPARGLLAILDAFSSGLPQRLLAGLLTGVVLSALLPRRGSVARARIATTGLMCGAVATGLSLLLLPLLPEVMAANGEPLRDLVSGALCGLLVAPAVYRASTASATPLVAAAR